MTWLSSGNGNPSVGWQGGGGGGGGGGSSWLLDGNTVGSEKAFGTLDAFGIPIIVEGNEVARYTDDGNYQLQNWVVDTTGVKAMSTNSRVLQDDDNLESLNWQTRTLKNSNASQTDIWGFQNSIFNYRFQASTATPNSNVVGTFGDILIRNNSSSAEMWLKQTGTASNTGWTQIGFALGYTPINKSGDSGIGNLLFLNNNGIDVDLSGGSDVLNIGVNNANVINIGWASTVVNIVGILFTSAPVFGTSINGTYLTASELLGTDGSKNIVSLPVSTYPSLTETSYVKGVTSSIQPQINLNKYWVSVAGTPVRVGNTSFTITDTANANLYNLLYSRTTVLKWIDSGVTKLAMIVSATYSSNDVTITIIGDTLTATATMSSFTYTKEKCKPVVLAIAGTIATGTALTGSYYASCPMKVFGVDGYHGTAGTTNATTYDLNKNGTTFMTTKLSIASGVTSGLGFTADSGTELALSDIVTVDCDSVSTTPPVDAYVELFMFPLYNQYLN